MDSSGQENELGILELIHCLVEALDKYFQVRMFFLFWFAARTSLEECIACCWLVVNNCYYYRPPPSIIQSVCELDIMHNLEKSHYILDEVVMNGVVVDANRENILKIRQLEDKNSNAVA